MVDVAVQPCARLLDAPTNYLAHGVINKEGNFNVKGTENRDY